MERGSDVPGDARCFADLGPEVLVSGRWRLKTRLGRGGFGEVFEAVDERDHSSVAMKLIAPDSSGDDRWVLRFEQEAEVAAGLRHPNIVRTLGRGGLPDGTRYLVMELLEGETLADRLRAGCGLPWPDVATLLEQLGDALATVHSRGIVHRDLKPSNLFIPGDPDTLDRAVLIDFGLCKGPSAVTASREQLGTLPYLAPEVLHHGARHATPAVDIYGLALVGFEAATGHRAFENHDTTALIQKICSPLRPPLISSLRRDASAAFSAAVADGLARDPERRPRDPGTYGQYLAAAIRA